MQGDISFEMTLDNDVPRKDLVQDLRQKTLTELSSSTKESD